MYRMQLGLALAAAIGADGWWTPGQELASVSVAQEAAGPAELPPPASLSRAIRRTRSIASRGKPQPARIPQGRRPLRPASPSDYPKSGYAADALYWQAFALYRLGGTPSCARRSRS